MKRLGLIVVYLLVVTFTSCEKDPEQVIKNPVAEEPSGILRVEFDHVFDTLDLALDTVNYILDNGDKIKINLFKYYISNVKLTASDNSVYAESESYYLINQSVPSSRLITIKKVPYKNYTSITFTIGVDSMRNVSGSQTGALDVSNNMFWTWSTGYIMAKVEGTSQQAPMGTFGHHIGGFSGANSALRTVTINFNGNMATVTGSKVPQLSLKCDLKEWFVNPSTLDLSTTSNITTVNSTSRMIADNYADMFSFEHLHN